MAQPLVFAECKVNDKNGVQYDSWELIKIGEGGTSILHAAWNPFLSALIANLTYHKENLESLPTGVVNKKTGQPEYNHRNVDTWYRVVITDKKAVQVILNTYVQNYDNQDWDLSYPLEQEPQPEVLTTAGPAD